MSYPTDVVSLAAELVRIPSVNPMGRADVTLEPPYGEGRLADYLMELLTALGGQCALGEVAPGRPNLTAFFDFGAPETILFEAHLDTVPVEGMIIPPFGGEIRDGRLWSRGACDVKGPMAAMISAIASAARAARGGEEDGSPRRPRYNVLFAAVCDEEYSFSGVRHLTEHGIVHSVAPEAKDAVQAGLAFAIVAEPTDLEPVVAHKGVIRWEATSSGVAAHASLPEQGRNAIYAMGRALMHLETYANALRSRTPHTLLGAPSLSVGTIRGGSAVNVVPDSCTIQIDRRLIPGETPESATNELRSVLDGLGIALSPPVMAGPAFHTPEDAPAAQVCLAAARAAGHPDPKPRYANYCTDASFYPPAGIPAVVFGPGSIFPAHTADEWIALDQLEAGTRAYTHILMG